jgi:hypothetical protein
MMPGGICRGRDTGILSGVSGIRPFCTDLFDFIVRWSVGDLLTVKLSS